MALRILLVDDNLDLLRALARQLRGHTLRLATDVGSAMDQLHDDRLDVVISDYDIPGGDGAILLEAVRRIYPGVQRVLMSGNPPQNLDALLASGVVQHFIAKPLYRSLSLELDGLMLGSLSGEARARPDQVAANGLC